MTEICPGLTFWVILWTTLTACLTIAGAVTGSGINSSRRLPGFIDDMAWFEKKSKKCVLVFSSESLPSAVNLVSASFSTDFVWLLLTVRLVCCEDSGSTSGVGLISLKVSGRDNFVYLSPLVFLNRNNGEDIGTAECYNMKVAVP